MGENERGFDDVTDSAGAGGDVLEGAAALREQGETAFFRQRRARRSALRVYFTGIAIHPGSCRSTTLATSNPNCPDCSC
jgi:hypothetical protein